MYRYNVRAASLEIWVGQKLEHNSFKNVSMGPAFDKRKFK